MAVTSEQKPLKRTDPDAEEIAQKMANQTKQPSETLTDSAQENAQKAKSLAVDKANELHSAIADKDSKAEEIEAQVAQALSVETVLEAQQRENETRKVVTEKARELQVAIEHAEELQEYADIVAKEEKQIAKSDTVVANAQKRAKDTKNAVMDKAKELKEQAGNTSCQVQRKAEETIEIALEKATELQERMNEKKSELEDKANEWKEAAIDKARKFQEDANKIALQGEQKANQTKEAALQGATNLLSQVDESAKSCGGTATEVKNSEFANSRELQVFTAETNPKAKKESLKIVATPDVGRQTIGNAKKRLVELKCTAKEIGLEDINDAKKKLAEVKKEANEIILNAKQNTETNVDVIKESVEDEDERELDRQKAEDLRQEADGLFGEPVPTSNYMKEPATLKINDLEEKAKGLLNGVEPKTDGLTEKSAPKTNQMKEPVTPKTDVVGSMHKSAGMLTNQAKGNSPIEVEDSDVSVAMNLGSSATAKATKVESIHDVAMTHPVEIQVPASTKLVDVQDAHAVMVQDDVSKGAGVTKATKEELDDAVWVEAVLMKEPEQAPISSSSGQSLADGVFGSFVGAGVCVKDAVLDTIGGVATKTGELLQEGGHVIQEHLRTSESNTERVPAN